MVVAFKTARKYFFSRRTPAKVSGNLNMKHNMHINQISQYFRVYLPFNLITITKSSTLFTHWTSAILTAFLKAWILCITSLRSRADLSAEYNHTEKRNVRFDKSIKEFDWLQSI